MSDYDNHCLERISPKDNVLQHIGVLVSDGLFPCTGYQLSASLFVTAGHCLWPSHSGMIATFANSEMRRVSCDVYHAGLDLAVCKLKTPNAAFESGIRKVFGDVGSKVRSTQS